MDQVIEFAKNYNNEMNAIIIFSEKEISANASLGLFNLAMITGKLGKTSSGLIALKEKNNSQGLHDMGLCMTYGVGGVPVNDPDYIEKLKKVWKVKEIPSAIHTDIYDRLEAGKLKNLFIFGEDPLGTTRHKVQVAGWLSISDFVMVQDYFMTETAKHADLIMPAGFPVESGGSFTNTQKMIQVFSPEFKSKIEKSGVQQLADLLNKLGCKQVDDVDEVLKEALSLLPQKTENPKHVFANTLEDNHNRLYDYGCDAIVKYFDDEFENAFKNN
jgi:predicted molibdopterin-dependent oxidoreductase YjgC